MIKGTFSSCVYRNEICTKKKNQERKGARIHAPSEAIKGTKLLIKDMSWTASSEIPFVENSTKCHRKVDNNADKGISILVVGATGATGLACLQRLSRHEKRPAIHAFCRDASKFSDIDKKKCSSIFEGDAREKDEIERALIIAKANVVVVCIGNSCSNEKKIELSHVRTDSARALVAVMEKKSFKHVRAVVVSRLGAETIDSNKKRYDLRWKKLIPDSLTMDHKPKLRYILEDHAGQEDVFLASLPERTTIVRPTALKDNKKATGSVNTFITRERPMSRLDLVSWIAEEICCGIPIGGRIVNISGTTK